MNESRKILTGMSHEIRTHMNSIVCFSFFIEELCSQEHFRARYGNMIQNSCTKLLTLVDNYFQSAMVDLGNSEVALKKCAITDFLKDLLPVFRETIDLDKNKKIDLIFEAGPPEIIILTDRAILSRIIQSLFQNAVNNMDKGYISVGYKIKCGEVNFYIIDSNQDYSKTYEFMHTNDLDRTLTKYFDATTAVNIRLAKKLIKLLRGSISVLSNDSGGTGIYISIPQTFEIPESEKEDNIARPSDL